MSFRRSRLHRLALNAAVFVQLWSATPIANSVVYCIGEDGHSGFELVRVNADGCAACCPETDDEASDIAGRSDSDCTDILISAAVAVSGKHAAPASLPSFHVLPAPVAGNHGASIAGVQALSFHPPRSSAARLLRQTVLLI